MRTNSAVCADLRTKTCPDVRPVLMDKRVGIAGPGVASLPAALRTEWPDDQGALPGQPDAPPAKPPASAAGHAPAKLAASALSLSLCASDSRDRSNSGWDAALGGTGGGPAGSTFLIKN